MINLKNFRFFLLLGLLFSLVACDELLKEDNNNYTNNSHTGNNDNNNDEPRNVNEDNNNNRKKKKVPVSPTSDNGDMPPRKNFTDKDLSYQGQSVKVTKHGRCRMECRKLDAYEIQEVINQGKVNQRKSDPNSKPCPTTAFEGKTSDGQTARIVVGTCDGDYKIVTVIDLDTDWDCNCK